MNKLKLMLLLGLISFGAKSQVGQIQQIKIVSFTVKNQLPAVIDNWNNTPGSLLLVAQKPPTIRVEGVRLVLQIRSNGAMICGTNASNGLPVDNFTTRTFSASELTGILSGCHDLKDGTYSLCAQFFNIDKVAISNEVCKEFTVVTPKPTTDYSRPNIITPADGSTISEKDIAKPIVFKWTPVVPPPPDKNIVYHVRVFEVMPGEQPIAVLRRNNEPVYTKDVPGLTQTVWQLPADSKNGGRKFIWTVQATNKDGQPYGENDGTSEPAVFSVQTQYIIQLDSLKVLCTATPGQYSFSYIITNLNNTTAEFQNINVYSSSPAGATISSYTPVLGTTIAASGGTLTVTGIINGSPSLNNICIKTKIQKQGDPGKNAEDYLCDSVKACKCDACDEKKVKINIVPSTNIVINGNNTLTLNQPISIITTPPKLVKSIKAELVYFEFVPESEDCLPCNKDSKTFGNFDNGTLANTTGTGSGTHSLAWNFTPPKSFINSNTAAITITLPPTVKCCDATIRWCIRYVVTFDDCTVCNKLVCYEKKKEGCAKGNPIPDNNNK
jgi:hypothetical protein